ncbi:MAG: PorP/SprF family type IX secretion system membrane protein, partial [Bacteroidota bacterium]
MLRQILALLAFLCFAVLGLHAQDPLYSQFYAAPLQLNPALAGNTVGPHIAINYRNQWPSIPNAYSTYSIAYSQFVPTLNSGFGLMLLSDDAGDGLLKTNRASAFFSYRVQVNRDFSLKLGTEASVVQARINWDRFLFLDQIDAELGPVSPGGMPFPTEEVRPESLTNTYLDLSAGILAYSRRFYGGISIKHLNTPNESFLQINENLNTGLPLRLTMHAGAEIELIRGNKSWSGAFLSPNIMFVRQGPFGQLNLGSAVSFGFVYGGVWYRHALGNA